MTTEELRMIWEKEESIAQIKGWDFSHIYGRYEEENSLPWDYKTIMKWEKFVIHRDRLGFDEV